MLSRVARADKAPMLKSAIRAARRAIIAEAQRIKGLAAFAVVEKSTFVHAMRIGRNREGVKYLTELYANYPTNGRESCI